MPHYLATFWHKLSAVHLVTLGDADDCLLMVMRSDSSVNNGERLVNSLASTDDEGRVILLLCE